MQLSHSSFWEFILTDGLVENSYLDEGAAYWDDARDAPAGSDFGSSLIALGVLPEDRFPLTQAIQACVDGKTPEFHVDVRWRQSDGAIRWRQARGTVSRDPDGTPRSFTGIDTDITELKRAEEEARRSRERLELAVLGSHACTWDYEMADGTLANSRATYTNVWELLGYESAGDTRGFPQHVEKLIPEEDRQAFMRLAQSFLDGEGRAWSHEVRVRHQDGSDRWHLARGVAERDAAGRATRFTGTSVDITDRKLMEKALRDSEERLRAMFDNAGVSMVVTDVEGALLDYNDRFCEFLGYSRAELQRSFRDLLVPDEVALDIEQQRLVASGRVARFSRDTRYVRKDGSVAWGSVSTAVIERDSAGKPARIMRVIQDITKRKSLEDSLKESEYRWRSIAETLPLLVFTAAADGTVEYLGTQACEYTGRAEQEMCGTGWAASIHPDDLERTRKSWFEAIEKQHIHEVQHRILRADGEYRWFTTRAAPARDSSGRVFKWVATCTDITALKQLEQALQRTKERLELAVFSSNLSLFEFELPDGRLQNSKHTLINFWEQLGYDPNTVPQSFAESAHFVLTAPDRVRVPTAMQAYLDGEIPRFELEHQVRHQDGSLQWRLARGMAVRDEQGVAVRFVGSHVDITDRKRVEEKLRDSEERWRTLVDTVPHLVFTARLDGEVDHYSAQTLAFLGRPESELLGSDWLEAIHPEDREYVLTEWSKSIEQRRMHETHHRVRRADGEYRWMTTRVTPLLDDTGQALKWYGISTDITTIKQLEAELRHAKELLELGVRGSKVSIFDFDMPDGEVERARQTMVNLWESLGYDPATAPTQFGPGSELAIHPDDLTRFSSEVRAYLDGSRQDFEIEFRVRRQDGRVLWHLARGVAYRDAQGKPIRFIGSFVDITDKKQAEERHRQSEQRWRTLSESLPLLVCSTTADGICDYYSRQAQEFTGLTELELIEGWLDIIHPDDQALTLEAWAKAFATETPCNVDYRIRRFDGVYRWFSSRSVPLRDDTGHVFKWVGTCTDIEERKQLAENLRESERRWQELAEMVPHFVWSASADGTVDYYSAQATEYTGLPESELHGFSWTQALHPEDLEHSVKAWLEALEQQRPHNVEHRIRRHDGTYQWFSTRAVPILDGAGRTVRWFGTNTNVEGFKHLEAELRASEQRWQHLAEMVPQQVWTATADGSVDYYNARATENTGIPESELHGSGWTQAIHPDDLEPTLAAWVEISAQPAAFESEHRVRQRDGQYQWFVTRAAPIWDSAGQVVKWFGTDTNVDSFKRLEAELRHAKDLLELGVRGSKVSIFEFDMPDGELENARQTMINLWESLGYDPVTAPSQFGPGSELAIHPDDLAWVRAEVHSYLNGERQDFEIEFRVRHKDGAVIWHLARGIAHRNSEGKVRRFIGSFVDITDKKQIEERLRASEQRWRSHAESLPQFVFTTTPDGSADFFSATTSAYTGLPQADLLGFAWGASIHPDDIERTAQTWNDNRTNRRPHQVEHRIRRADGVYRWFTTRAAAVWGDDGNIVAWFGTCTDIENLKQLEAELRHARDLLELGVRGSKVSIFEFDMPNGDIQSARPTMINLWESLGYDPATAPTNFGHGSELAIHPDDLDRVRLEVISYLNGQRQDFEIEFRVRHKDGRVLWHLARGVAHRDAEGKARRFIGSFVDITDKKHVEERHRESEQRWRTLAEALPLLVYSANAEGVPDFFSAQTVDFTGVSEVDLCEEGWLNSVHPDDRARVAQAWAKAIATASEYEVDYRIRRADGVHRWFTSRARPVLDGAGGISRWFGTCTDIEERRLLAEELRASEQRWRSHAETLPQLVFTMTPEGMADYFSATTSAYTGIAQSELLGAAWLAAIHPDDRERTAQSWEENRVNRRPQQVEHRIRRADGVYRWFTTRATAVWDGENIVAWFGTCTDVENLKQLEADLRQAKERLELAIRSANLCIWEYDMPGGTLESSRETLTNVWESFGYDLLDPPPSVASVIHPEDLVGVGQQIMACLSGESPAFESEHRVRHYDGSYHWILGRGVALRDSDGRPTRFVGTSIDINAIKRIEADLLRAREAAESANRAKDEFLANVSHEIRTPMNAILGMTELALDSARSDHQKQLLATVRSAARNLLNIINDLLDFSKIAAGKLALDELDFSLRAALSEVVRALAPRAQRKGLELVCDVHADAPDALFGDVGRLRQVLMNLIGNALKFTAQGEVVVQVTHLRNVANVDMVSLRFTVRDTGIGIARDKQVAIFRAFEQEDASTTRKFGGTGLGLTISSQLVGLMGGEITVDSEPGRGSTFAFTANFARSSRPESSALAASPELLEGLRVLVVDDNETNRRVLVERLTEWRMRPMAVGNAASAVEALARADDSGAPYSLVLLDARMPDIDGISLAAELQARFGSAAQRLILLSSDDDPVLPARSREAGIQGYLLKPVQQSELLETIWAVMNMPADGLAEVRSGSTPRSQPVFGTRTALRILVAEDNELNVALLRELLSKAGHRAEFAGDGRAALGLLTANAYDLLLLDLHMPEMDGFEVVQAIREQELGTNQHLPIVALTARSSNRDRERCLAAGMDDFLSKPIEADTLWAAIERIASAFLPNRPRPSRLLDHGAISRACGGRQGILEKLCEVFQRSLPEHVAKVRSALDARDLRGLSEAAHLLYGTVAAFSTIAGALALNLEGLAAAEDLESCTELVERLGSMCSELLEDARSLVDPP